MTAMQDWNELSLMNLFRLEVETQTAVLSENLLILECEGQVDDHKLDALMRAAHSIKGAARIVQIEAAVKVSHALEDCFLAAQRGALLLTSTHVDILLAGSDFLQKISIIEEFEWPEKLAGCEAEANVVVEAIEEIITQALSPSRQSSAKSPATTATPVDSAVLPAHHKQSPSTVVSVADEGKDGATSSNSIDVAVDATEVTAVDDADEIASSKQKIETAPRIIRMSADNLNRLMGLAGESLVEANWIEPFAQSLLKLKQQQQAILSLLDDIPEANLQTTQLSQDSPAGTTTLSSSNNAIGEAKVQMLQCHELLSEQLGELEQFSRRFGQLSDRLYREVIASHMCAFEIGVGGYRRLVRDLSKEVGKQAHLKIKGLRTQVDRDILTKLDAPISHLLTNAIAHGIEAPEVRAQVGKPPTGQLLIEAAHRSGMLVITVADDGAGIDFDQLGKKVVAKGLTTQAAVAQMSKPELLEFLFLPGFSTAGTINHVAGRGYGLDLARSMAQSVGGSLQVSATPGQGTQFQFQLPLTLSVVRSLLFEIDKEPYAISLSRIDRVVHLSPSQIFYSENQPYFSLADTQPPENISLVLASQLLDLSRQSTAFDDSISVVIMGEAGNRYGLCVDRFLGEKDLVVRPLDPRLGKVSNISAAALTEAGDPILILDVADVLRSAEKISTGEGASCKLSLMGQATASSGSPEIDSQMSGNHITEQSLPKRVLVVDDSMTVRAMERKLLANQGYAVDMAVNGVEGWNQVRIGTYDLVITDIDMPRMNGIALIEYIRSNEATKALPIIVVSYKDRQADQLAGLDAGANYYLTKSSFHNDGLINAVKDLIGLPERMHHA